MPNVEAHITGTVWKVECEVGQDVEEGDTLEAIVEEYVRECERSRAAIAGAGLDDRARGRTWTSTCATRWST